MVHSLMQQLQMYCYMFILLVFAGLMVVLITYYGRTSKNKIMTEFRSFDKDDFARLKDEYEKALALGNEQFVFDKQVLLVSYAKYLIEYLESKFNK